LFRKKKSKQKKEENFYVYCFVVTKMKKSKNKNSHNIFYLKNIISVSVHYYCKYVKRIITPLNS